MEEIHHETRTEEEVRFGGRFRADDFDGPAAAGRHPRAEDPRSVGQLFRDLAHETTLLFRQEVELAKTEMQEKAAKVGRNSAYAGVGGAVAYAGLLAIVAAACIGLALALAAMGVNERVASWLGPLVVGLIVAGIGYAMLQKGITTIKQEGVVPHKTADSLQETRQWMNAKIR